MKFEKISQEDREKLERRLYKTIVEEFRREKIKDGYYKYIVSLQEFKFITDITDNELKESISIAVDTMEELKKINNNDGMNKSKRLNFRHGYKNPRPHFCNRSTLIIHI